MPRFDLELGVFEAGVESLSTVVMKPGAYEVNDFKIEGNTLTLTQRRNVRGRVGLLGSSPSSGHDDGH
jgi:hypothetical protein